MSYYRGDFLGSLKRIGKAAIGAVGGFVTGGPIGAITGGIGALSRPGGSSATSPMINPIGQAGLGGALGKAIGTGVKLLPGIAGGIAIEKGLGMFGGGSGGRRRSMNHLNPKALARATRRVEGFVKKARKAVSPLGYTVVRRGSGRAAKRKRCR